MYITRTLRVLKWCWRLDPDARLWWSLLYSRIEYKASEEIWRRRCAALTRSDAIERRMGTGLC